MKKFIVVSAVFALLFMWWIWFGFWTAFALNLAYGLATAAFMWRKILFKKGEPILPTTPFETMMLVMTVLGGTILFAALLAMPSEKRKMTYQERPM